MTRERRSQEDETSFEILFCANPDYYQHAAVAAVAADQRADLQIALHSRDIIGQAKGILMERYKIRSEQAFDLLIAVSQRTNRKLREVADTLADTGEL